MHIVTTTDVRRPVEEVFDFLTTPGNWPRWHPSSLKVAGAVDHSLEPGEQVTEDFRVAGQCGKAVWTVREKQAPHRWVIDGVAENGNRATVTYTLTAQGDGTRFERELVFVPLDRGLPEPVLAELFRQIRAESAEALRRLKALLEEGLPAGPVRRRWTMTHDEVFLADILEHPDDDAPRLVYADWLEEQEDPRGEFIRVQVQLARMCEDDPRRPELAARGRAILAEQGTGWTGSPRDRVAALSFCNRVLKGGMVPVREYLEHSSLFRLASVRDFLVDLTGFTVPRCLIGWIPECVARENLCLPLGCKNRKLTVALRNRDDRDMLQKLEFILNRDVEAVQASAEQIIEAINRHYGETEVEAVETLCVFECHALTTDPSGEDAPVAKLVNLIIQEAITARATEIYIQPGADRVQVGYRIDGVLVERDSVSRRLLNPVIARIRNMAILPCVADGPHGGWFKLNFQGESHNVDAAIYQTDYGPSVVLTL